MGMDATVHIWVGVKLSYLNDDALDWDELKAQLPKELFDEDGDMHYSRDKIKDATDGLLVAKFRCSDEDCGFGVEVFSHDWDYGVEAFDIEKVKEAITAATAQLQAFFRRYGIAASIGVWCQTNYS